MSHFFADLKIVAALTNAFYINIIDNPHANYFIIIARKRLNFAKNLDYVDENERNRECERTVNERNRRNRANFENNNQQNNVIYHIDR